MPSTVTQTSGPVGDALELGLIARFAARQAARQDAARQEQIADEAEEARWVGDQLDALAAEAGPAPF